MCYVQFKIDIIDFELSLTSLYSLRELCEVQN